MKDEGKKNSKLKIGCLSVVGIVFGIGVIGALLPEPSPEEQAARKAERVATETAEANAKIDSASPVTARELAAAFEQNEVAAQQNYGDRDLLVTGEVTGVTLDFMDEPVVQMGGVYQFQNIQASLEDADAASRIRKGQTVRMICGKLTEVLSAPMLDECVIVE